MDTLELIDLDALMTDEALCQVVPPHHCTVTALYLLRRAATLPGPEWRAKAGRPLSSAPWATAH